MIDYQNLPSNAQVDWFMQPTAGNEVHTWTKPAGCNFVYMIAVGAGGGGGAGRSKASGSVGGGGAGGASGAITRLIVPAFLIPDTLYLNIGVGKPGTIILQAPVASNPTIISAYRVSSVTEYILYANGGNGGGGGAAGGSATGPVGPTPSITNNTLGTIGIWKGEIGVSGSNGSNSTTGGVGPSNTFNYFLTGGAGGGAALSTDFAGGNITSAYKQVSGVNVVNGGPAIANAVAGQNNGGDGFFTPKRFASYGGAGGGASANGVGGNGGNGGPGCGGGGGGSGITGGAGGRGGDGFALIISY